MWSHVLINLVISVQSNKEYDWKKRLFAEMVCVKKQGNIDLNKMTDLRDYPMCILTIQAIIFKQYILHASTLQMHNTSYNI